MSEEVSLDKLLAAAGDKNVGANASSILEMLKETNKVLVEAQKTIDFFRKIGVLPGVVRALGKKWDIDMETPLKNEMSVAAPSSNHKTAMENISKLSDAQLIDLVKGMQEYGTKKLDPGKPGNKQPDPENN